MTLRKEVTFLKMLCHLKELRLVRRESKPLPMNAKELQSLLGLAGYNR